MFKQLLAKAWLDKRAARQQWDAGLAWFRLRYLTPDGPTRCLRLLSRPQACGRVALYFRPDEAVSELYLGLPETHVSLLQHMAADFHFSLKPGPADLTLPPAHRLTRVSALPWKRPFLAHVVNELLFVSLVDGEPQGDTGPECGSYLPQAPVKRVREAAGAWQLPANPTPGLTTQPSSTNRQPPAGLIATRPDPRRWLLGRSPAGIPLHVSGRVNIYGRQAAVADWLVHQVTQMVTQDPANLIILDGTGDLGPQLKRKAAITRLLGERLTYVDIDCVSLVNGFNPLAAAPGETGAALQHRWQRWFRGMNVHPQGVQLLVQAQAAGVMDIPSLRKWLKQVARQGPAAAIASLGLAVTRLTASRRLREWLEWPVNCFDILPTGGLLFTCRDIGWDRQQMLRALLLAATHMESVRLVVHGFPWQTDVSLQNDLPEQTILSNGPLLAGALPVLVQSPVTAAQIIGKRLLYDDKLHMETIQLLGSGEGMLLTADGPLLAKW